MRVEALKFVSGLLGADAIRNQAAHVISNAERVGTSTTLKQELTDFFTNCAAKAGGTPAPSLPTTQAVVASGVAITVPVTGTYVSQITPTVVDGAITGFVLR